MPRRPTTMRRWSEDLFGIREAWGYFEEAVDALVTDAGIQSDEDRRATAEPLTTMEEFKAVLDDVTQQVTVAGDGVSLLRRIDRDLDLAGKRADDALAGIAGVISEGEAIAIRAAHILGNRPEADVA